MKTKQKAPSAETAMLIRRPVAEVFEAFIDPAITTKFWFTKSTGKLEKGKEIKWTWEMYNVSSDLVVRDIIPDNKIEIEWGSSADRTRVEWTFEPFDEHSTYVSIINDGFEGDEETILSKVSGSTGGFCWVLAGLKAYLEYHIQLNLVADRYPEGKH